MKTDRYSDWPRRFLVSGEVMHASISLGAGVWPGLRTCALATGLLLFPSVCLEEEGFDRVSEFLSIEECISSPNLSCVWSKRSCDVLTHVASSLLSSLIW